MSVSLSLPAPNGNYSSKLFEIPFAEGFLLCRKLGIDFLCLPQLQGPVEDQLQILFFLSSRTENLKTNSLLHTPGGASKHCSQSCFTFSFPTFDLKPLPRHLTLSVAFCLALHIQFTVPLSHTLA